MAVIITLLQFTNLIYVLDVSFFHLLKDKMFFHYFTVFFELNYKLRVFF